MKLIVDSHVLLWLLFAPERIGQAGRDALDDALEVQVSSISFWELALKHVKGKLPHSPDELVAGAKELNLVTLALEPRHILALPEIELAHSDPFDTMLCAQTVVEQARLVTADRILIGSAYATLDPTAGQPSPT